MEIIIWEFGNKDASKTYPSSLDRGGVMKQVQILKIVVASPGDVQAERDVLPVVIDELN